MQVFIGGGTGITPLMSMLREAAQEPSTPVIFSFISSSSSSCQPIPPQPSMSRAFHTSNQPPLFSLPTLYIISCACRPSSCTAPTTPWSTLSKRSSTKSFSPTNTSLVQVYISIFIIFSIWDAPEDTFPVNYTLEGESKLPPSSSSRSFQPLFALFAPSTNLGRNYN